MKVLDKKSVTVDIQKVHGGYILKWSMDYDIKQDQSWPVLPDPDHRGTEIHVSWKSLQTRLRELLK